MKISIIGVFAFIRWNGKFASARLGWMNLSSNSLILGCTSYGYGGEGRTMRKMRLSVFIISLALLTLANIPKFREVNAQTRSNLEITWYSTPDAAYSGLKNDQVDFVQWTLTLSQFVDAQTDPNVQLASFEENGIYEFDINNNYTMGQFPSVRSPTNELNVRKAIAHLINKTYIIEELVFERTRKRIDVPVSNAISEWWNTSVTDANYPYPNNPDQAAALLAGIGFNDTDGNGYLNYPSNWEGIQNLPSTDTTSMPIYIYIRQDHPHRATAGNYLVSQLEGNPTTANDSVLAKATWPAGFRGGDFDVYIIPYIRIHTPVWYRQYHIYTGGWSLSKFPARDMYYMFHSQFWEPFGSNYNTGVDSNGSPNYPDLDEELENAYYAQDVSTAMFHSKNAQSLLIDKYCVSVWLWNYWNFNAYRKELVGAVSHRTSGLDNRYTYLNAFRAGNPSALIKAGVPQVPEQLNVLYSMWSYDWLLLDAVYPTLLSEMPYSIGVDQPWVAQDWELGTWDDHGMTKTMATFWIRKDVGCAEPVTGNLVDYFTAEDLEFSIWYNYAFDDSWSYYNTMDINHIRIINDYQVEVYFDDYNIWQLHSVGEMSLLGPANILLNKLCEVTSATFAAPPVGGEFQFGGTLPVDGVVQVINATANGNPITEDADFYIRGGYDAFSHNVFVNQAVPEGANVTIFYYKARTNGADGFYLGGNLGYDWTDTMYSYGMYYPISINPIAGGKAELQRNPHFFMETPRLGEIDWRWNWEGTVKPRSGSYKLSILDVVLSAQAYSTRGDGVYDPHFLPAADLDENDLCHIGILDLITITASYGASFGKPPDG